jgi:hypothetical protein
MKPLYNIAISLLISTVAAIAQEKAPLHIVISEVGNKMMNYGTKEKPAFRLMAEIEDSMVFSLRGDFKKVEILSATTVAPDGKIYQLKAVGEQPEDSPGNVLKFLYVSHGDNHTGFSIGNWKVDIKFMVDDKPYAHMANYLVTWRKREDGIWQGKQWVNESKQSLKELGFDADGTPLQPRIKEAEQGGTGQPATRPESMPEGSDKPQPEAEGRSR